MNRNRIIFALIIVLAAVGIGAVVWYVLRPVLPSLPGTTKQPPRLPAEVPFDPRNASPKPPTTTTGTTVDQNSPAEKERQAEEALKRDAMDFAARQGTYSSVDNFEALRIMTVAGTAELRTKLEARLAQLRKDHPSFGPTWTQTIRPLSGSISASSLPVLSKTSVNVEVQSQQITNAAGKETTIEVLITVTFVKQGEEWIPSDVTLKVLNP